MFLDSILLLWAALTASLAHCVGMCGGIVLGFNMRHFSSKTSQILANILYFLGRSCSYIVVGIIFTLISTSFGFNKVVEAILFIVLGILLFCVAFCLTFYPKFLDSILPNGNYAWYKKAFKSLLQSKKLIGIFAIGILNGLLPCHLVYMFALQAANTMSITHAMINMALFSLGTFLPLFLVGIFSASLLNSRFRVIFLRISFVIMTYFAAMSIYHGITLLSNQNATQHHMHTHHAH